MTCSLGLNVSSAVKAELAETNAAFECSVSLARALELMLDGVTEAELRTAQGHECFPCSMCETISTLEEGESIFHFSHQKKPLKQTAQIMQALNQR